MALKDALAPIKASNCIDITFEKAVVKALTQVYEDMAAGQVDFTVAAGTGIDVVEDPAGTFTVSAKA